MVHQDQTQPCSNVHLLTRPNSFRETVGKKNRGGKDKATDFVQNDYLT